MEKHRLALQKARSLLLTLGKDAVQRDHERRTLPSVVPDTVIGVHFITLMTNTKFVNRSFPTHTLLQISLCA